MSDYQAYGLGGLNTTTYSGKKVSNSVSSELNLLLCDQNSVPLVLPQLNNEKDFGLSPSSIDDNNDASLSDELFMMLAGNSEHELQQDKRDQVEVQQSNITTTTLKCTPQTVNPSSQNTYNQRSTATNIFSWLDKAETLNMEKQRKHSHNLIERRRRYRINDTIKELETLLPGRNRPHSTPQNKSSILTAAVDYIKKIQGDQERIQLEERLRRMEQHIVTIIKVLQCKQSGLMNEQTVRMVDKCTEKRIVSNFKLKGYIPIYQANRAEDNDDNIEEIYASFEDQDQ